MSVSSPSVFLLSVSGQVEAGRFMGGDNLHFNYCFTAGQDWEVVSVSHSTFELQCYEVPFNTVTVVFCGSSPLLYLHIDPFIMHENLRINNNEVVFLAENLVLLKTSFCPVLSHRNKIYLFCVDYNHHNLSHFVSRRDWRNVCHRRPVVVMMRGSCSYGIFQLTLHTSQQTLSAVSTSISKLLYTLWMYI